MLGLSLQQIRNGTGWPRGARFVMLPPPTTGRRPTVRQLQIAQALADGLTMREAAAVLGVRYDTARTHAEAYRRRAIGAAHNLDRGQARRHRGTMYHAIAIGFREGWLH